MSYEGVTSLAKGVLEAETDAAEKGEIVPPVWTQESYSESSLKTSSLHLQCLY
jgi:hypothetical protein